LPGSWLMGLALRRRCCFRFHDRLNSFVTQTATFMLGRNMSTLGFYSICLYPPELLSDGCESICTCERSVSHDFPKYVTTYFENLLTIAYGFMKFKKENLTRKVLWTLLALFVILSLILLGCVRLYRRVSVSQRFHPDRLVRAVVTHHSFVDAHHYDFHRMQAKYLNQLKYFHRYKMSCSK
jgi:hypothetical protein